MSEGKGVEKLMTYYICNCNSKGVPNSTGLFARHNYELLRPSVRGKVVELLQQEGSGMSIAEITDCLGMKPRSIRNAIYRLDREFKISKYGQGPKRYALK
jgi:hypothetical protein